MKQYPFKIDNGIGEEINFLGLTTIDGRQCMEVENRVSPGQGPPMHVHLQQDESLTVIEGTLAAIESGKEMKLFYPGDKLVFKAGVMHRFWNAGQEELRCKGLISPVDNFEYFISAVFNSVKSSKTHRPATFDMAWLLSTYKTEFDMELPGFVKNIIFPTSLFFGKLRGLDKKFKDAPTPVGSNRNPG